MDIPKWLPHLLAVVAGAAAAWTAFRVAVHYRMLDVERRVRRLEARDEKRSAALHALDKQVAVIAATDDNKGDDQ